MLLGSLDLNELIEYSFSHCLEAGIRKMHPRMSKILSHYVETWDKQVIFIFKLFRKSPFTAEELYGDHNA